MTAEKVPHNTSPDDIDLINLLERMFFFFRRFRKVFVIAIIAGILLGFAGYFLSPKMYESKLILHSSDLTNQEELEIIDYWNQLLKRNEYKILAPVLNCSEELLHRVVSLQGVQIQKNYSSTDPNGFYIDARIRDNSILTDLQNAIVFGLNNTEYVKQKFSARKEDLKKLIDGTNTEMSKLDSTKNRIEDAKNSTGKNSSSPVLNVTTLNRELIDLTEKLISYQNELKYISSVQVLQGFMPLNTPVSRSLAVTIVMGLILCLSVAYLFSLLKYIEDRLKKRLRANE
jgi:hypothetical protein